MLDLMEHTKIQRRPKPPFLPVRSLVLMGTIIVLLGVCSWLYASRSASVDLYRLLAAVLIIAGLGTFSKIPQQRRVIREAEEKMQREQL
jgi:hypothetical protein